MCKIIVVASQKGGVTKTVVCPHLSRVLADKGYRVLAVDMDAQSNLTASLSLADAAQPQLTIYELLNAMLEDKPLALGCEYSLTGRSAANYLRIHKLIDGLKVRVDNGGMTLAAGVSLSFLSNANQQNIENTLGDLCYRLTDQQADLLRKEGKTGIMTIPYIRTLLAEKPQKGVAPVRVRHETYAPYFPASTPPREIERVIGEALRLYFTQQIKEDSA